MGQTDNTDSKIYDLIVIGGGAGGSACTHSAAEAGYRVAQIERDHVGGTCLNYGCDPTKTMLHIGQLMRHAVQAKQYGLQLISLETDWSAVRKRVEEVQREMRGGTVEEAEASIRETGITLVKGEARFISPHAVEVDGQRMEAKQFLIATGTEPLIPEIAGLEQTGYITNRDAVTLERLPKRLAVIGSGPVGTEFAQLFANFGVDVSLFDQSEQILPKDDPELAGELASVLEDEGIQIYTNAKMVAVSTTVDGKQLTVAHSGDGVERTYVVDEILLALGRKPALDALNLTAAGVDVKDGQIVVDEMLRTSVSHIWAAGDIVTNYPFTHTADAQSELLANNIFAEEPTPFDSNAIPWVTYTTPALAHVGKTEAQLRDEGIPYRVGQVDIADVARAQTTGEKVGQVKLLVTSDGEIVGGHILAVNAGDLIGPIVLAMRNGLKVDALQKTIFPYPTMVNALRQAARTLSN